MTMPIGERPGPLVQRQAELALTEEELLRMHQHMTLLRVFDERCLGYHRQGRVGPAPRIWGHEAVQVGAFHALRDEDWIFPSYRETALGALRGMSLSTAFAQWRGHPAGWWNPEDHRIASACIAVGTQVPHAAGFAWGQRLRGRGCSLVFFGDGATSEGAFHEGANFAAVMNAPLVLLCSNNGWAISTPLSRQTRAATLADKAAGYGMPGVRVDGTDVLAVYRATRDALERARRGEGPTLIEAVTYRLVAHGTADDNRGYADLERIERERKRECLAGYESLLRDAGLLTEEQRDRVRAVALAQVRAAIREAERLPEPDPDLVFTTTYASPPPALLEDRRAFHARG